MTQMGLDYLKYKESNRHNLATEAQTDRAHILDQSKHALDVRKHEDLLPIEQQKAEAQMRTSFASASQAATAARKQEHFEEYLPHELAIKQQSADAQTAQAKAAGRQAAVASGRLGLDTAYRERETRVKEGDVYSKQAANRIREREVRAKEIANEIERELGQARNDTERFKILMEHANMVASDQVARDALDKEGIVNEVNAVLGYLLDGKQLNQWLKSIMGGK